MKVILTSFRDHHNWEGTKFSIARWQPKGYDLPQFPVPIQPVWNGKPMTHLTPLVFRIKYERLLNGQGLALKRFFGTLDSFGEDLILCCWCFPERQPKYDKLYCHRILLGYWIEVNCQVEMCSHYTTTGYPYFKPRCKGDAAFASLRCHSEARGKSCPGYKKHIEIIYADGAENPIWER